MSDTRPRRIAAVLVALCIVTASEAGAQNGLPLIDDASLVPRGLIRLRTPIVWTRYDLRFANEFWALAHDTDLYLVVANWPEPRREHWRTLLRARAIENQAYVLGANRVGAVRDLNHVGDSAIVDPLGRTLAEASIGEAVLVADVTAEQVRQVRESLPFLRDRR